MRRLLFGAMLFSLIYFPLASVASAGEPTEQLKQTIDKVLTILRNAELKQPGRETERRAEVRKAADPRFDYEEMAKRSLAVYWKKRSPEEKNEFTHLFSDVLDRAYIRKIESYHNEKVAYTDEVPQGADYVFVKTKILDQSRNVDIPIEYRMLKKGNQWLVYDVVIEGVSLVNNYRTQFTQVIRSSSYEDLVRRLKAKEFTGEKKQ